jgi:hypothetical protein
VVSVPLLVWLSAQSRRASDLKSVISTRITGTTTSGTG